MKTTKLNSLREREMDRRADEETDWSKSIALVGKVRVRFVPAMEYRNISGELKLVATGQMKALL